MPTGPEAEAARGEFGDKRKFGLSILWLANIGCAVSEWKDYELVCREVLRKKICTNRPGHRVLLICRACCADGRMMTGG